MGEPPWCLRISSLSEFSLYTKRSSFDLCIQTNRACGARMDKWKSEQGEGDASTLSIFNRSGPWTEDVAITGGVPEAMIRLILCSAKLLAGSVASRICSMGPFPGRALQPVEGVRTLGATG